MPSRYALEARNMKIVYEPLITAHDTDLYRQDAVATNVVEGWTNVEAAVSHYKDQGYLVVRGGFGKAEVEAARNTLQAMTYADDPKCGCIAFEGALQQRLEQTQVQMNPDGDTVRASFSMGECVDRLPDLPAAERAAYVRKFMDFTSQHPELEALASHPNLLEAIGQLMGGIPVLFQEMAMIKPPKGREKPWHQDHAYFNFALDTNIVGVWIALEEALPENGCMFILAGAHQRGAQVHFMRRDWQICDSDVQPLKQTAVPMQPGDVLFFDGKLPHGTPINKTNSYRWALQYHYLPKNAVTVENDVRMEAFGSEGKAVSC